MHLRLPAFFRLTNACSPLLLQSNALLASCREASISFPSSLMDLGVACSAVEKCCGCKALEMKRCCVWATLWFKLPAMLEKLSRRLSLQLFWLVLCELFGPRMCCDTAAKLHPASEAFPWLLQRHCYAWDIVQHCFRMFSPGQASLIGSEEQSQIILLCFLEFCQRGYIWWHLSCSIVPSCPMLWPYVPIHTNWKSSILKYSKPVCGASGAWFFLCAACIYLQQSSQMQLAHCCDLDIFRQWWAKSNVM